ncbi:acyl-CoA thioesterase [Staphylococcus caprae]|uniref:acyl-CoA thioesterase n=1 Tax=Staphylococcus caprae TaxID=29380 RepID=UPI001C8361B5|nr:thioesterase family protein [Staphylococcus caprae]MBX5318606.1 acyl-CoA thioesterase [Staphylococcus caprae]
MSEEGKLVAEKEIEVNNYDIDAMGIVSNIVYVRWFEDLRTVFINQHMNYSEMLKNHISPILMKTEIEYKVPVTIHDRPIGRCWLMQASKLKWIFKFEISSGDKIHCVGSQMGGFYHLEQQKITKMPQVFQDILKNE